VTLFNATLHTDTKLVLFRIFKENIVFIKT